MELIELGNKLKELRRESGKSLEDISQETGLNRANLSNIENGKRAVSYKTLNKLFNCFGYEIIINIKRLKS